MLLKFDLTLDDLIAFNLYHQRHSLTHRRLRIGIFLFVGLIFPLAAGLYLAWRVHADGWDGIPSEMRLFLVLFVILFPIIFFGMTLWRGTSSTGEWVSKILIRGMLTEGKTSNMIGPAEVEITPHEIQIRREASNSNYNMSLVEKIGVTDEHAFIYVAALMAVVVPRRAFDTAQGFDDFVRTVETHSRAPVQVDGVPPAVAKPDPGAQRT